MLAYTETPLVEIRDDITRKANICLFVKREDLNHPTVSGNKWWKLKYNLLDARAKGHSTILTFGGAYSNHIFATAAAAHELGMKCVGVIRGEPVRPLNKTLAFASRCGMHLHYISREQYKQKDEQQMIAGLQQLYGEFYLIPEGGTNALAVKGMAEFGHKILPEPFEYLAVPVGTGGTISGLIGSVGPKHVLGFPVVKNGEYLEAEIEKWAPDRKNWSLCTDYHCGGYGKLSVELIAFINAFEKEHWILLDPIYTGKMMMGLYDQIRVGAFAKGSRVLAIHTGGLQGWNGIDEKRYPMDHLLLS